MRFESSHLIIVCCHGIWRGGPHQGYEEDNWLIAPFQKQETPTFIEHIKAGLQILSSTPNSLLVFSGGPTRSETRLSEAESYARLAKLCSYWDIIPLAQLEQQIVVEDRALDSFHNVLFSLTKFYEVTGRFPDHVTVVSNEFKRARFLELHFKALRWSSDKVTFKGIDPDYMLVDLERAASVRGGERRNGFEPWEKDPYGTGEELELKRTKRNPWNVSQLLFDADAARSCCIIDSVVLGHREVLGKSPYPWE